AVRAVHVSQRRTRRTAKPWYRAAPGEVAMKPRSLIGASPADPLAGRLVIVGCSAEKTPTDGPLPALELYDGGCVPPLRARLGDDARLRARVRFLSAQHGLVTADTPLRPYDRPLDPERATVLRPHVMAALHQEMEAAGVPSEVLVVAEP